MQGRCHSAPARRQEGTSKPMFSLRSDDINGASPGSWKWARPSHNMETLESASTKWEKMHARPPRTSQPLDDTLPNSSQRFLEHAAKRQTNPLNPRYHLASASIRHTWIRHDGSAADAAAAADRPTHNRTLDTSDINIKVKRDPIVKANGTRYLDYSDVEHGSVKWNASHSKVRSHESNPLAVSDISGAQCNGPSSTRHCNPLSPRYTYDGSEFGHVESRRKHFARPETAAHRHHESAGLRTEDINEQTSRQKIIRGTHQHTKSKPNHIPPENDIPNKMRSHSTFAKESKYGRGTSTLDPNYDPTWSHLYQANKATSQRKFVPGPGVYAQRAAKLRKEVEEVRNLPPF